MPRGRSRFRGLVAGWTKKLQCVGLTKTFFREVRMELKKVTWPTRKETLAATAMVIIFSVVVAFFLGILDVALAKLVGSIMGRDGLRQRRGGGISTREGGTRLGHGA